MARSDRPAAGCRLRERVVCHALGVPAGATSAESPSLAHSSRRRSACAAGRSRPVSPISPKAAIPSRTRRTLRGGDDRERDGEVGAGLVDADAAGDVDEDVRLAEGDCRHGARGPRRSSPAASGRRRSRPGAASPGRSAPRAPGSRAGAAACPRARTRRPRRPRPSRAAEQLGGLGDADEPGAGHLEDAELVRRAEAVLGRAQDAVLVVAVSFELEHAVDEMLQHARARDRAVLRHVADEEDRDPCLLGYPQQPRGRLPHLRHRARRRAELCASRASGRSRSRRLRGAPAPASRRRPRARSPAGSRSCRLRRGALRGASPGPATPRR